MEVAVIIATVLLIALLLYTSHCLRKLLRIDRQYHKEFHRLHTIYIINQFRWIPSSYDYRQASEGDHLFKGFAVQWLWLTFSFECYEYPGKKKLPQ